MTNKKASKLRDTAIVLLLALALPTLAVAQSSASAHTYASRYNINRQLTGTISPDPDGAGPLKYSATRNAYNAQGLLSTTEIGELSVWKSEAVDPANWGADFTAHRTQHFTYDAWGRKLTAKAESGGTAILRQFSYDSVGRLSCETTRMNPAIYGQLPVSACTLGAESVFGPDRITRYGYDERGRVRTIEKAVGTTIQQTYATYEYDLYSFRKPNYITDANGNRARKEYDGYGRTKKWIFPSKTAMGSINTADYESYGYDLNGNRTTLRKRDAQMITYTHDDLNRITRKDLPGTVDDVYYDHDQNGLQLYARFGSSSGSGITNVFDGFGRLEKSTQRMDSVTRTLSYLYDANGNRTRVTHPDNQYFTYAYDGLDRATQILENGITAVVTLAYDNRGRRDDLNRINGALTHYEYDPISRLDLLSHNIAGTADDIDYDFGYNPASQVVNRTTSNVAYVYTDHSNGTESYTVNGLNQYTNIGGSTVTYDDNGNLTSDGATAYDYDIENRLTSASGATTATLKYDPQGRLYETSGGGTTTRFLYDGDSLVAEYNNSGAVVNRYTHGPGIDEPLIEYVGSAVNGTSRRNLYADHLGSITAITDSGGSVININSYDSYGIPDLLNSGRFAYTGQIVIPELGLYHYKARIYSPRLGRFLQTDPIGYGDNMNMYAYAQNSPTNAVDPSGLDSFHITRPTDLPGGSHAFILVTNVDSNGNHTIRERFTFGAENAAVPLGRMQRITDPNRSVFATDAAAADSVVRNLNTPPNTVPKNVTSVASINAPDDLVVDVANSVTGSPDYDLVPDLFPGNGVNSNTAPAFIATTSAQLAGNEFQIPDPDGLQPGTDQNHIDQVEHTVLPPRLRNRY